MSRFIKQYDELIYFLYFCKKETKNEENIFIIYHSNLLAFDC